MRVIPLKNYFLVLLLAIFTILVTFGIFSIKKNVSENEKSYISTKMTNITANGINNYLMENSIAFIYIDNIYNDEDNDAQKDFINQLNSNDVSKYFVFLDNSSKENKNYISKKYNINIKNKKMVLFFEDEILIRNIDIDDKTIDVILSLVEDNHD